MFNRSLAIVDERVNSLSLDFSQLLVVQSRCISDIITQLAAFDLSAEKIPALTQASENLSTELQQLSATAGKELPEQQEKMFKSVRVLKNKTRLAIDTAHPGEEKNFQGNTAYTQLHVITALRKTLDDNGTRLEFMWRELLDARTNFLTSAELAIMAHSTPAHADQKVAQQVLTLIQTRLPLPPHLQQSIQHLEAEFQAQQEDLKRMSADSLPVKKRRDFDESLDMIRAILINFQSAETRMLDKMLNRNYLRQIATNPKQELRILSGWIKERDLQFKNSVTESNQVLLDIKNTLQGNDIAKKPSLLQRLGHFMSRPAKNKVLPTSEPDKKRENKF